MQESRRQRESEEGLAQLKLADGDDAASGNSPMKSMDCAEVMCASASALTPGDKLPSIRSLGGTMNVSTSTVVEACERLAVETSAQAQQADSLAQVPQNVR